MCIVSITEATFQAITGYDLTEVDGYLNFMSMSVKTLCYTPEVIKTNF